METQIVNLDKLLLDPNNYRLHSNSRYKEVKEKDINNQLVQKRVQKMIEGDNRININNLIDSIKSNGFLHIDNILVRRSEMNPNFFIVIEGNRRITSLKALKRDFEEGYDVGKVTEDTFNKIKVVVYSGNDEEYSILMGLRHVSGIKEWNEYEQSELIMDLKKKYDMPIEQIADRLGLRKGTVKSRINAFIAMEKYKNDEDYGEEFLPEQQGAIFYEVMSKPAIKEWLGWNQELNDFTDKENLKRFFSWISPTEEWQTPIITKRDEIRVLSKFIKDSEALDKMEECKSVSDALEQSMYITQEGLKKNLNALKKNLAQLNVYSILNANDDIKKEVKSVVTEFDNTIQGLKKILGIDTVERGKN